MKRTGRSGLGFAIVAALIFTLVFCSIMGVRTRYGDIVTTHIKGADDIRWGIDIRGGVDVTFMPEEGHTADAADMAAAMAIIEVRLVSQNITDYEAYTDVDNNRIIVRFPWKEDEADFDPQEAIKELGETAMLTFREGVEVDADGKPAGVTADTIILQGQDVANAEAGGYTDRDTNKSVPVVMLELSEEGAKKFSEATTRLQGKQISIWMDDTLLSAPSVQDPITDGNAMITGMESVEAAADLANKINAGALPFRMVTDNYSTISPSMGAGAKDAMILAGGISLLLIIAMMLVLYRLPGMTASIALCGQIALMIAAITGFLSGFSSFTLTIPGIAGIILSIGMGVDCNIIVSERIREELESGKTIDSAIQAGYKGAFSAIFDGNVTVVIAAVVLMGAFGAPNTFFGTILKPVFFMFGPATAGNIYSFGYTLLIGVLANFVMGIGAGRMMLLSISKLKPFRNTALYGVSSTPKQRKQADFIGRSKVYYTISIVLMTVVLVSAAVMKVNLDIQFKGGSIVTYAYDGELELDDMQAAVQQVIGIEPTLQQSSDFATGQSTVVLTLPGSLSAEEMDALDEAMKSTFGQNNLEVYSISNVDAVIGREFLAKSVTALAFTALLMVVYIAYRFRKIGGVSAGVMAVIALLHDVFLVFGVFVLFRISINDNFMAVVLTIIGYSLNDTIVVYDRIRENERRMSRNADTRELVNASINQMLKRTILTSLTTILTMVIVSVVAHLYGVSSIISFSFPIIIGLISGTYSSVFLAPALWYGWKQRKGSEADA